MLPSGYSLQTLIPDGKLMAEYTEVSRAYDTPEAKFAPLANDLHLYQAETFVRRTYQQRGITDQDVSRISLPLLLVPVLRPF